MKPNEPKLCPFKFINKEDMQDQLCSKEDCAWWVVYYKNTEHEFGECAISSLSFLIDF